jgi:hypothetical protein
MGLASPQQLITTAVKFEGNGVLKQQPCVNQACSVRITSSVVPVPSLGHGFKAAADHNLQPRREHLGIAEGHVRHAVLDL